MKRSIGLVVLVAAAALAAACTNKQGETEQPVTVTVDLTDQAGLTNINPARIITIPTMVLTSRMKNPDAANPAGFADVQMNQYIVHYHRADGGTRLPPDQTFAVGQRLPSPGSITLSDFPVLSQSALQGTPFDQLLPFNGGIDQETGSSQIQLLYDVTFFGQTVSGQRVQSETATAIRVFFFQ
jgi:hypothetical protein